MGFVRIVQVASGRGGEINDQLYRRYTKSYFVETDNSWMSALAVILAPGIPRIGQFYTDDAGGIDTGSFCVSVAPKQRDDNPYFWDVTVEYDAFRPGGSGDGGTTAVRSPNPAEQNENPLLRPAEVSWGANRYSKFITTDLNNNQINNSAGDLFSPLEIDDSRPVLTIARNEPAFDPNIAVAYQDAVNSDIFFGQQPNICKMQEIAANRGFENGYLFWKVSYKIEFRREGWQPKLLDQGLREFRGGKYLDIFKAGNFITEPWPLNGGLALSDEDKQAGNVQYRTHFVAYKQLPFAPLNLL